jgi:hypothetical protein
MGVAELYDYEWYYGGFPWTVRDPEMARILGIAPNERVVYFPRRTFDMWNTRYFVVPMWPNGWNDSFRGYAAFLLETENVYPVLSEMKGPVGDERAKEWTEKHDFQIRRNQRSIEPTRGLDAGEERQKAMKEITYDNDSIWNDRSRQEFDWRRNAWVDRDQRLALSGFLSNRPMDSSETVKVTYPSPQRVELDVTLKSPGIVVLADIYYPGWELTIDGVPAPIYPVNQVMRGAAVKAGSYHLVYTYAPRSFRIGVIVSGLGLAVILAFGVVCYRRPIERTIGEESVWDSREDHQ